MPTIFFHDAEQLEQIVNTALTESRLVKIGQAVAEEKTVKDHGPVVQSVVSLTSSLRVISLTVLADSIYNILLFFAEKM